MALLCSASHPRELVLPEEFDLTLSRYEPPALAMTAERGLWKLPLRRALGLARPVHALLADAHGVWAWEPRDCHAGATRHASVSAWLARHPGCDLRLWVGGELARSVVPGGGARHGEADDASGIDKLGDPSPDTAPALRARARRELVQRHGAVAQHWPLATWHTRIGLGVCALSGIDLPALTLQARHDQVRIRAVVPWWYHAFSQAARCVNALNHAPAATVCVVEGRQLAWISTTHGELAEVQQTVLENATVAALHAALTQRAQRAGERREITLTPTTPTIVLGQGLTDGAQTQELAALNALVLGRLDGAQPPQWLRPSLGREMH